MSQKFKISELTPHKDNNYFFDDISGDAWIEFLESVKTSGVIEPIVITQDKVIVSGHQRVRACKVLGIEEIDAEVRIFDTDDEILKCLIETNIRQRGIGNTNPVKFGRCIKELERIYGIQQGKRTDLETFPQNAEKSISQEDLASQFGLSVDTLNRYKQLAEMIPEMQTLVETGIVTPTTARAIVKQLPEPQQRELAEHLAGKGQKSTGKETEEEIKKLKDRNAELERDAKEREDYITELENREPEITTVMKEVVREVIPEDIRRKAEMSDGYKKDFKEMKKLYDEMAEKWKRSESEKESLISEMKRPENEKSENIKRSALFFCAGVSNFIEKYGGYVWLTQEIGSMEEEEREGYIRAINAIDAWVSQMKSNIGGVI